ncbi:MAG: hypothetical protein EOP56_05130 [Sphingobacteriales bacterium]|nr:MAG: hypothetical protein EOP56_05130 [Sphingobacteriales bacterium]
MDISGIAIIDLQQVTEKIDLEYYVVIDQLNRNFKALLGGAPATGIYLDLCRQLCALVSSIMEERRAILVPYLMELQHKEADGHNCSTCSGGCKVQHGIYVASLSGSHAKLRAMIDDVQRCRTSVGEGDAGYRISIYELTVTNALLDLFELEEQQLIPEIVKAQKAIHAY